MILLLHAPDGSEQPPASPIEHLLARAEKDGKPAVRGPLVEAQGRSAARPLEALADGEKLHLVAAGTRETIAGYGPTALVDQLEALGLSKTLRLKQIHLIADDSGTGGESSFAQRFTLALQAAGFQVHEIKAPRGRVRWDGSGKIHILPDGQREWLPSERALNFYTGPEVQPKHRT